MAKILDASMQQGGDTDEEYQEADWIAAKIPTCE